MYDEIRERSQGKLNVAVMCELAKVSRASFYRSWEEREPDLAAMELRDAVHKVCAGQRRLGHRRVTKILSRQGWTVGKEKVLLVMRKDNLLAVRRRRFVATTNSDHEFEVHPNLAQHLNLSDRDQLWVADLTYVRLAAEFVFCAVVLDAYSRMVVGWAVGRQLDHSLPLEALNRAIDLRKPGAKLVHHSDRGTQYACATYTDRLKEIGAVISMSRPGRPWENGKCESFIKTLKAEEIDARPYRTLEELSGNIGEFIEQTYNKTRLHSALNYLSPEEFEAAEAARRGTPADAVGGVPDWLPAAFRFAGRREVVGPARSQGVGR